MTPHRAAAPSRSPSRRTRRSHRNLRFHFLTPPACRPFRRRTFARFYLSSPLEFCFHFLVSTAPADLSAAAQRDFSPHRSNSKTASLQKAIVSDCGSLYHIFAYLSTIVENFTVFPCKFQQNVPNRAIFSHFFHFFIKFSQIIVIYSRFPLHSLRPSYTSPTLSTPRSAPLSPLSAPICPQICAHPHRSPRCAVSPHPHRASPPPRHFPSPTPRTPPPLRFHLTHTAYSPSAPFSSHPHRASPSARPKSHFFQNFSCIIPLYVL